MTSGIEINTLKQLKRSASVSLKFSTEQKSSNVEFLKSYRIALDKVKNQIELDDLESYKRIYWCAWHRKDNSIMKGTLESMKFQFEIK